VNLSEIYYNIRVKDKTPSKDVLESGARMTIQELQENIDTYGRDIYSFCRHLTGSTQEADELYQDTWLTAVERLDSIVSEGNIKSFCLSVALRLWKNRKRKFSWRRRIAEMQTLDAESGEEYIPDSQPSPEAYIMERERDRLVREAVDRLPEKYKAIVLLYYMEEMPLAEIASAVHIPEGTVKSRLYQARMLLRKKLEGIYNERKSGCHFKESPYPDR